jgi:uncharacterized iron-regulated protein
MQKQVRERPRRPRPTLRRLIGMAAALQAAVLGCALPPRPNAGARPPAALAPGVILDGRSGAAVSFEEMVAELRSARIVYVGEKHTAAAHHAAQLRVITALNARHGGLAVGMEMFDRSYQPVLDLWAGGGLVEPDFLRRTHWYANWRYDYALYRPILDYVRQERIRLVGLNLPFYIPPKIRVGGTAHLSDHEKQFLPAAVDTGVEAHREYARKVFAMHEFRGGADFEDFYLAQCVWEDGMAEAVAAHLGPGPMVVLAGNGHIRFGYGIPQRAFRRTGAVYRTVYLAAAGEAAEPGIADFIWAAEPQ